MSDMPSVSRTAEWPRRRPAIARPRLSDLLSQALASPPSFAGGFTRRLTLVCGPAGFGKTTVIANWLRDAAEATGMPEVAWVSLEALDNDPSHFGAALNAALGTAATATTPPMPLLPSLANRLLSEMVARARPVVFVLDDYHHIQDGSIHEFTAYLIEHLPPVAHLILISRADPPLALGRLRATQEMNELRARELRFSLPEIEQFLNHFMRLSLAPADVSLLAHKTEGWIAGLQLAAYALNHDDDPAGFLQAFAGDNRFIADYLVEEVLLRQPEERQQFLLQTSILGRLSSELCDAVTGRGDSRAALRTLEAANLFITPLDPHRHWYRYHQLFADLLRERLLESGQDVAALHRRAAAWYRDRGLLPEAIDHALEANDPALSLDLMLLAAPALFGASQLSRLTQWSARLTDSELSQRPSLLLGLGWAWIATGHPERAEHFARLFETAVGHDTVELCGNKGGPALDKLPAGLRAALVEAAAIWSRLHANRLEIDRAMLICRCALQALDAMAGLPFPDPARQTKAPPDGWPLYFNHPDAIRPVLQFNMGLSLKIVNEAGAAEEALSAAAAGAEAQNNVHLIALAYGHLAEVQRFQGKWRLSLETCRRGQATVQRLVNELPPLAGLLLAEEGLARYEMGETAAAEKLWLQAIELAEPWGNWEALSPAYIGLARLRAFVRRDAEGALDAVHSLRDVTRQHAAIVSPIAEAYERLFAAHMASAVVPAVAPLPPSSLPYLRERQILCELRIALVGSVHLADISEQARRMADEIDASGRPGSALPFYILCATVLDRLGRKDEARDAFNRALAIARPDGVIVPFQEDGAGAWLPAAEHPPAAGEARTGTAVLDLGPEMGLVEMPSPREQEVLRLIASGLSNREIALRLFVTEGTVKNHAHSLYGKLDVTNRTQAIARARQLGLL